MNALLGRKKKEQGGQDQRPVQRDDQSAKADGPSIPFLRKRSAQPPKPPESRRKAPEDETSSPAGPASGASLAKLNLENAALREASADSTVGAGRLFARPTVNAIVGALPCLRASLPISHAHMRKITRDSRADAKDRTREMFDLEFVQTQPAQLLKGGEPPKPKGAATAVQSEASNAPAQASGRGASKSRSPLGSSAGAVSTNSSTSVEMQREELRQVASESMVGAGQVFKRPSPAQMLKMVAHTGSTEATEDAPPQPPKKSPAKAAKTTVKVPKVGDNTKAETSQQSAAVKSPEKPRKKERVTPTIQADAVQIGRLDPIPEEDEEWSSDDSNGEESESMEKSILHLPVPGAAIDQGKGGGLQAGEIGEGEPKSASLRSSEKARHERASSNSTPQPKSEIQKTQSAKSSSSLQQLPLIKIERDAKPAGPASQFSAPEHASLEEANAAREAEVLRIQQMASLPSASLPLELEGFLSKGITDDGRKWDNQPTIGDTSSDDDNMQDEQDSVKRSSEWTDFARERAKALGQAVDDAEHRGVGKAKLKLNPGVNDVLLWLCNIGWGQYEETFAINQIDHDELFILTDQDLQEMGMKLPSNRHMLLDAISALKEVFKSERDGRGRTGNTVEDKNVFIAGRDKREKDNSDLIPDQTDFEQKKGYVTWSDHSGKKWRRGFAVLQGGTLHIFKSSDHVVLKPLLSQPLQDTLIYPSEHAENCLYIQANTIKKGMHDVYLCGPDEEERDAWQQHLVAAANLQLLQHLRTRNIKSSLAPIIVMLDEIYINKTGPYALPRLEVKLMDKNGSLSSRFDDAVFNDGADVLQPSAKGSIAQAFGQQIMLSKRLRRDAGPGSVLFFEFRHTMKDKTGEGKESTQYWSYAFVDDLRTGDFKLDLMKKPPVYDPLLLRKGTLPKKDKSFVGLKIHVKDVTEEKQNASSDGIKECSRALVSAIRRKVSTTDQAVLSTLEYFETVLESLQVLDGPGYVSLATWEEISSRIVDSGNSIVAAERERAAQDVLGYQKRIAELEAQVKQQCSAAGGIEANTEPDEDDDASSPHVKQLSLQTSGEQLSLVDPSSAALPPPHRGTDVVSKYVKLGTSDYPGPAPSVRMRPFYWRKVPPSESLETIWTKAQQAEWHDVVGLHAPQKIEALFAASQTVRTGVDMPLQVKMVQKTALIDLQRAHSVNVMLSKFRCTFKEVKEAVTNLDASLLDIDKTTEMIEFVPSDEEIEILKTFTGDVTTLGSAERFFIEILGVPRHKERLQIHQLILTFDDRCTQVAEKLSSLIKCLIELTKSKRLRRFMLHVLAVGNFMNYGTSMGNAPSFRLEDLNQAVKIRSNVEGVSLLHFLVAHIHNTDPDLLRLPRDLAHAEAGAAVSLSSISEMVAGLEREKAIAVLENGKCGQKDPMRKILATFLPHANVSLESVTKQLLRCQSLVNDAKALFAEARPAVTQENLCGAFSDFKSALLSVMKDNEGARAKISSCGIGINETFDSTLDQSRDDAGSECNVSMFDLAPTRSLDAGMSPPRSGTSLDEELELNKVTLDGLLELGPTGLEDLGVAGVRERDRMATAISKPRRERSGGAAAEERSQNPAHTQILTEAAAGGTRPPAMPPRSRASAIPPGPLAWGVCYGEAGAPSKGQKIGWIEVQTRSKTWEKYYAKRARNTLVLFASETDLSSALRKVCLDGVIVHRSDDRRPFVVEARKSIFQETKDDLFLAADSKKEAASWEKALIKGSMWHAENKNQNAASSSRAAAGGAGGGLTPEQVENVGHTFKFQSVKSASPALKDDGSGGVGVIEKPVGLEPLERSEHRPAADSLAPPVPPRTSGTAPEKEAGLRVKFLKLELPSAQHGPLQTPFLAVTTSATINGKLMLEPGEDVQIRGQPGDVENETTIGEQRLLAVPSTYNSAEDLRHLSPPL